MPVSENLSVGYHQQDTDYYCGAACAQMVLNSIGAGLIDQNTLYSDNHSHSTTESGWYTAPDGLNWTLNNLMPASFPSYFVVDALASEPLISRRLVWTLHHYKVAPVAMVFGSQHWIVVRGYTASAAPASWDDSSYSIDSFDVNNPEPPTPGGLNPMLAPPPPHSSGDGCGTGGSRGVANENIAYATWQADYMTGVPSGHWGGQFVAVCDPERPPTRPGPPGRRFGPLLPDNQLLALNDAAKVAMQGLETYGLVHREPVRELLRAKPQAPVVVQRLDRADEFYYIVPYALADATPLAVIVDARRGEYRQSVYGAAQNTVFATQSREVVAREVVGRRFELPDRQGSLYVRPEAVCQYPYLVWKPCRQSLSPYYPFHMFTVGGSRIYVRVDGAIFTELTDWDRGI